MATANDDFILRMFEKLGLGTFFNDQYKVGKEQKFEDIPFSPGKLSFPGATLEVLPKLVLDPGLGEDFYVMKGYLATRKVEGQEPVSQFLPTFKTIGFDVDQANELLRGGAVRYVSGYVDRAPQYSYAQINFEELTENKNFKLLKRAPDDEKVFKVLGTVGIVAKQEEKDEIFKKIVAGQRVPVVVRRDNEYPRVFLQIAARKQGLGINEFDGTGKLLVQYPKASQRQLQPVRTMEPVVSPTIANMVTGGLKDAGGDASVKLK